MELKNRSLLYWSKVFIVTCAVLLSVVFSLIDNAPVCLYCQISRASFIALFVFYVFVNSQVLNNFITDFAKRHEKVLEYFLVTACFLAGLLALFSKYGILSQYFPACGEDELVCRVDYQLLGLIDLKTLSFLGGLSLLILKCVESIPRK